MSNFSQSHLAYVLYTAPRLVNEGNLTVINHDIMKAFAWASSDSPNGVNMYSNIEYGMLPDPRRRLRFGFKLRDVPLFLSEIFETVKTFKGPSKIVEKSEITQDEWRAVIGVITQILKSFESYGALGVIDSMPVFHRSLTYKLYASSQLVNDTLLPLFKQSLMSEFDEYYSHIDYGVNHFRRYKLYGFRTRFSQIPISSILSQLWDLPPELRKIHPILGMQGAKENIPTWWKTNYANSAADWDQSVHPTFGNLWSAVIFCVIHIVTAFEHTEAHELNGKDEG